ncbi:MAG: BNR-4 repeat-containing protein, partial [Anaerolineae bacterium]
MRAQSRQLLPTLVLTIVLLTSFYARPAYATGFFSTQVPAPIRFGGASTNAEMATYQGSVYIAYADEDFTLTVARHDARTGIWTKATRIDQTLGQSDPSHNQMALAIDGDGYIHVWYGMHNRQGMRYARSNSPDNVLDGFTVRSKEFPNANESYTYPNAASAPNGDIYFSIRNQGRRLPLFHWDNKQKQWQELVVFVEGTAAKNDGQTYVPYLPWLYVDSANNVHIKWDWAFGDARSERHNGSYALYRPDTGRFYRADGTEYALPITALTAEVFQPMPEGVTWNDEGIALSDMVVDAQNQPVISYAFSPNGSANLWEHRVAHWDGSQWNVIRLTDQTKKWNKDFLIAD